jgi:hypothetical protein
MLHSPSRSYRAEVEESDCGAVSGFDTDVIICKRPFVLSHLRLGTASDLFFTDGSPDRIRLHWEDDNNLTIECVGCKDRETQRFAQSWKNVAIRYIITAQK